MRIRPLGLARRDKGAGLEGRVVRSRAERVCCRMRPSSREPYASLARRLP